MTFCKGQNFKHTACQIKNTLKFAITPDKKGPRMILECHIYSSLLKYRDLLKILN